VSYRRVLLKAGTVKPRKTRIKEIFAAGKLAELSLFQALQLQTTGQKDETEKTLSSPQSAVIGFKPPCFLFITKG